MTARRAMFGLDAIARSFVDADQDRTIKRGYLHWFKDAMRVLDLGCGSGVLIGELRDVGIDALGIDASHSAIELCRSRGLAVECADALTWLSRCAETDRRFDGIAMIHLVEHLPPDQVLELIGLAASLLSHDGTLLIVTPNFRNQVVAEEVFWLDPTHVRPYPRLLLERMCMAGGLRVLASLDDPESRPRRGPSRRLIAAIRSRFSGVDRSRGMDSIVVATSRAEAGSPGR